MPHTPSPPPGRTYAMRPTGMTTSVMDSITASAVLLHVPCLFHLLQLQLCKRAKL